MFHKKKTKMIYMIIFLFECFNRTTHVITKRILDAARCIFVANFDVLTRLYIGACWKRSWMHPLLFRLNAFMQLLSLVDNNITKCIQIRSNSHSKRVGTHSYFFMRQNHVQESKESICFPMNTFYSTKLMKRVPDGTSLNAFDL